MIAVLSLALLAAANAAIDIYSRLADRRVPALDEEREVVSLDDLWDEHCATAPDVKFLDLPAVQRVYDLIAAAEARRIDDEWRGLA